ncbi:MAG: hypothetical protein ACK4NF_05490, partial [Planctomycetota bacterium]
TKNRSLKMGIGSGAGDNYLDASISSVKIGAVEKIPLVSFYPQRARASFEIVNDKHDCIFNIEFLNIHLYLPEIWNMLVSYSINGKPFDNNITTFKKGDKLTIDFEFETGEPIITESPAIFEIFLRCPLRSPAVILQMGSKDSF